MTNAENLQRAIEDRGMLESDIDLMQDEIRSLMREGVLEERVDYLEREINLMEDEVLYLTSVIESYEAGYDY